MVFHYKFYFGQWADVESLIKELENTEGIESVSKGRFFLSPGLAPTFQVEWQLFFSFFVDHEDNISNLNGKENSPHLTPS